MIEFLLLDYEREQETRNCVRSIKENALFDHKIRLLHNGPLRYYHLELLGEGMIDHIHSNDENLGCGVGTIQLFAYCKTKYAIYVQVDQRLFCPLTQDVIDSMISVMEAGQATYIDLAGNQGHGTFSERAALIPVAWYNSIKKTIGGPGPWAHMKWTEECVQDHMKIYEESFMSSFVFEDNGKYSRRKNPDGSEWLHETDTKKLILISGPVKERYVYPKFTDAEWDDVLSTQSWPKGEIPETEKPHSFVAWK